MRRLPVLLTTAALLLAPTAAGASSLVYTSGGNIWLAHADGSAPYQVTSDGGYASPSESDAGAIVATRAKKLVRMSQNGAALNTPVDTSSPLDNVGDPRVSPDGSTIAYWFASVTSSCGALFCGFDSPVATAYSYADRFGSPAGDGMQNQVMQPAWISNTETVMSGNSALVWYQTLGAGDDSYKQWFSDCDFNCTGNAAHDDGGPAQYYQPAVARTGDRLAIIRRPNNATGSASATDEISIMTMSGPPPATPTPVCEVTGSTAGFASPTWSADGSELAWAEADGIHIATVGALDAADPNTCTTAITDRGLVIPGGSDPSFGLADANPAPRTGAGGGTGGSPGTGGTPGAGGTPGTGGAGSARLSIHVVSAARSLARHALLTKGEKVSFRCAQACTFTVSLTVKRTVARRYGVPMVLGSAKGKAGTATRLVTVRLTKRERRALAKAGRLRLTLLVTAKASGRSARSATTITVHP
jgi:WD40-like Beta Propeller Repeat